MAAATTPCPPLGEHTPREMAPEDIRNVEPLGPGDLTILGVVAGLFGETVDSEALEVSWTLTKGGAS